MRSASTHGWRRGPRGVGQHALLRVIARYGVLLGAETALDTAPVLTDISVMTEITDHTGQLSTAVEQFVLHWGDMGSHWGVNRSVAQIHAFLYLAGRPVTADEIAAALGMARSNVSNSIKELLGWNLIRRIPIRNDRRDHFEAEADLWEMFLRIAAGRKEREIDPAIAVLRTCVAESERDRSVDDVARTRLKAMLDFVEMMNGWYTQMLGVPRPKLAALIKLGAKVFSILPIGKKK
jgi:DNA-binding transcriptional regulator GbsR (MarR family)